MVKKQKQVVVLPRWYRAKLHNGLWYWYI